VRPRTKGGSSSAEVPLGTAKEKEWIGIFEEKRKNREVRERGEIAQGKNSLHHSRPEVIWIAREEDHRGRATNAKGGKKTTFLLSNRLSSTDQKSNANKGSKYEPSQKGRNPPTLKKGGLEP